MTHAFPRNRALIRAGARFAEHRASRRGGALSNVEYTLTVTDTVTGAQRQYHNPSGRFASVGDPVAF